MQGESRASSSKNTFGGGANRGGWGGGGGGGGGGFVGVKGKLSLSFQKNNRRMKKRFKVFKKNQRKQMLKRHCGRRSSLPQGTSTAGGKLRKGRAEPEYF